MRKRGIVGIELISGDDRVKAGNWIDTELGEDREVFEGEDLVENDLPSLFFGETLFSQNVQRKILIKNLSENKAVFDRFAKDVAHYTTSDARVIIWEGHLDKRSASYKMLSKMGIKFRDFSLTKNVDIQRVFEIYDVAMKNGANAVKQLESIENEQDPYVFLGVMVSKALKNMEQRSNGKTKKALKELSKLDINMKTTGIEPWLLIKGFLIKLSTI